MEANTQWVKNKTKPFQLSFNGLLKVDFQGSHVTSDGGLILVRELDERLGLGELIDEHLSDSRQGTNKQFTLADLLRQSVYSRLAGYEGPQRRRAGFDRSDVSADRFAEDLGSRCGLGPRRCTASRRRCWRAKRTCWG